MNYKQLLIVPVLLGGLAACSGNNTTENNGPQFDNIPVENKGAAIYQANCNTCHGADGTAGIGNAANLKTSQMDSTGILSMIVAGKGTMPSFKGRFTDEELHKLATYVYALRK